MLTTSQLSPLTPAIFGETLEDIMRYEFAVTPTILPFLTESITKLNGLKREGIFRYEAISCQN